MSELRPVFYVSDGTGITAETIGHSLLTQFAGMRFQTDRLSFVDDEEKARDAACASPPKSLWSPALDLPPSVCQPVRHEYCFDQPPVLSSEHARRRRGGGAERARR